MAEEKLAAYEELMSGSLIALYKMSHDDDYNAEYIRRLTGLGFSEGQAHNMFLFELMILKHDHISGLCADDYIYRPVIDPARNPLPQEDSWYIDHQWFLVSEIVKVWDEAEFVWVNRKDELKDEKVRDRVYSLTRYGGGELVMDYLRMVAEKTGTDEKLIQAYARAEQDLLFLYRWKDEEVSHPYRPEEVKDRQITVKTPGKDKVATIRTLRMISDWELSLKEAADIVNGQLPYTASYLLGRRQAEMYMRQLEDSGAEAEVTVLEQKTSE